MQPREAPRLPVVAVDLSDAEFQELDDLLAGAPEPLESMDAVMLDGYLCGVLVQPVLIGPEAWLPWVFDSQGRALPEGLTWPGHERARALALRRHSALNRSLLDDGWFDPLILEEDDEAPAPEDPAAGLNPLSRPLMPWVAGFRFACETFPPLLEMPDSAVPSTLARLFRHLPAETDADRELVATVDRGLPLASLEDAIADLVDAVAELAELTHDARYHVETVRRELPKVGRNDPCPCGSGKKFKQCHGAG